ncbi:hypothetical protein KHQ81_02015 [Mycoplasmatota bacterium]|nr:hypothetical protein KHQ81_02015 [Mycoplasmatota bacterium]
MKKLLKNKKIVLLIILVALAGIISIYTFAGKLKPINVNAENISFTKDDFIDASKLSNSDVIVESNDRYEFHFDEKTTHFYIKDILNDKIWHSNPQVIDDFPVISKSTKIEQKSTLVVHYNCGQIIKSYNNYSYSIYHEDRNQTYSYKYIDNGVQVLYRIEDTKINYTYFPQFLSKQRMNELFLDKDLLSDREKEKLSEDYYELNLDDVYELKPYEDMSKVYIKNLNKWMYEKSGYTLEDCIQDNAEFGKVVNFEKPYFEVAVEYKLTDSGFKATVINESIVENSKFPITSIEFLPYFGATTIDDDGYFVIPDGSGALMNFNNGKTYATQYSKKYYGNDLALQSNVKPETSQDLLLPIYGIVKTNTENAMLGIIEKGAPMTSLYAGVSERIDSYNRINLEFKLRDFEKVVFSNAGEVYELDMYTKKHVKNDFVIRYELLDNEDANYFGLAKRYQQYLVENQGFEKTDNTQNTVLNLKLLGMYEKREFFLGVPYNTTKTLTTFDEAKKILAELNTLNVNDINLIYDGWFNNGMDHKIPTNININSVMGGKGDFKSLSDYTKKHQIGFYPSVNIMKVNQFDKAIDSLRYTTRHINGKTSVVNNYDLATKLILATQTQDYVLKPELYHSLVSKMLSNYGSLNVSGITLNDLGSEISGDYRKYQELFRDENQYYQVDSLNLIDKEYDMMMYAPYGYAVNYATDIVNLPQESSQYPILDSSIPFYQIVLNGYKDYTGISINENVERNVMYYKLKAIETGANINYIWSYKDSSVLLETEYNYYYSTNYRNWINGAADLVHELDNLGIHEGAITNHEVLTNGVYKVTYENGSTFIINYNQTPYLYTNNDVNIEVAGNNYQMIGGRAS